MAKPKGATNYCNLAGLRNTRLMELYKKACQLKLNIEAEIVHRKTEVQQLTKETNMNPNTYSTYLATVDYKVADQQHLVKFELSAQNPAVAKQIATDFVENADTDRGAWEADCGIYDVELPGKQDERIVTGVAVEFVCKLSDLQP